jgi:2-amino-4-hydroxy-6-hydroxymethyldihydropteridine diphosphokinase
MYAYLGLGSNIGDGIQNITDAIICLAQNANLKIMARSNFYQSEAILDIFNPNDIDNTDYINAAVAIDVLNEEYSAHELLKFIHSIESQFMRVRKYKHAARCIDIDILIYGEQKINDEILTIPHPLMHKRAFVLLPLLDIYKSDRSKLAKCLDCDGVKQQKIRPCKV